MKELKDIIKAYDKALSQNKQVALATVVHVEGSSYRRPGARMLVSDDGQLTGAISGGCLEGDALRKALLAITQGQNKLVTYDTTDEDDLKFGMQLGCNGIVHILFEPIQEGKENNPVYLLNQLINKRQNAVLVTLFSLSSSLQHGTCVLYQGDVLQGTIDDDLKEEVLQEMKKAFQSCSSNIKQYKTNSETLNAFIEFIPPPVSLVIAGAGNDAQPLVQMASLLGWHITVVDGRPTHATSQRFSQANKVIAAKPENVLSQIESDYRTVVVLMTHNYNYDIALLPQLIKLNTNYIGILGPKKKLDRMFDELQKGGQTISESERQKIYSPVGLDIGAETPEEIAVSIVAEIKAVLSARSGISLKDKTAPIHNRGVSLTGNE